MPTKSKAKSARNRRPQLRGKGDYTTENSIQDPAKRLEAKIDHLESSINRKMTPKTVASTTGRALGSLVGMGDLGSLAGESLAKLFGHGDFEVKNNSLIKAVATDGPIVPRFSSHGKRGTRIVEREYLGDVFCGPLSGGSTSFTNQSYIINPTNSSTFPWLSIIASQYDQWEPHGIVFEFVSTSSEYNGSSQALGTVILSTDYDVLDAPYTSKQYAENADYACSTKPSKSLLHGIECDPKERPLPVMYCSSEVGRFQDLGNFQVCTQGCSVANVNLGELWISYDISFYKKQIVPAPEISPFWSGKGLDIVGQGLFSNQQTFLPSKQITLVNTPTNSIVQFDPSVRTGRFLLYYAMDHYDTDPHTFPTSYVGCTMIQVYGLPSSATGGNPYIRLVLIEITNPSNTGAAVYFDIKATAATYWYLQVSAVPTSFNSLTY